MIDLHLNAVFENVNEIDKNRKIAEGSQHFYFLFFVGHYINWLFKSIFKISFIYILQ